MSSAPVMIWRDGEIIEAPQEFLDQRAVDSAEFVAGELGRLQDYARQKSRAFEAAGIEVGGVLVFTDRESQAMITGMAVLAQIEPERVFPFDSGAGPVELTATQALDLGRAVGAHVQAAFGKRASVLADISAGEITNREQIDAAFED